MTTSAELWQVVTLRGGHNTNVVLAGTFVLGVSCAVIGTFLLLRRRSLIADALSHAALPGVCAGFLVVTWLGGEGRSLGWLLTGAAVVGLVGVVCVQALTSLPRVREDAAIGVVLSVSFAAGIVLLSVIQALPTGSRAGLSHFIFGQAATMRGADSLLIAVIASLVLATCLLLFKELRLLCFDLAFAQGLGWSKLLLDGLLLAMLTLITVAGLHSVGAILMVALLIIPPATARFWTQRLRVMLVIAAAIGGAGCFAGTAASAVLPHLPTGPAIVLACGVIFATSLLVAPRRGVLAAVVRHFTVARSIAREHLLRAMYEQAEMKGDGHAPVLIGELQRHRRWAEPRLSRLLRRSLHRGEITTDDSGGYVLTRRGLESATELVRRHRLWEYFLSTQAGVAPSHVDRDADEIEHVLGEDLVHELEASLRRKGVLPEDAAVPRSVHRLGGGR